MKTFITILLMFSLLGCVQEISSDQFFQRWEESKTNSAVSWWYAGEDESHHYFIQKNPTKSEEFKVSKKVVALVQIKPFPRNEKPKLNLKFNNIKRVKTAL